MDEADIIFCPYNYLIDPLIRSQVIQLSLFLQNLVSLNILLVFYQKTYCLHLISLNLIHVLVKIA